MYIQIEIPDMLGCQSIQIERYLICWGVYTDRDTWYVGVYIQIEIYLICWGVYTDRDT